MATSDPALDRPRLKTDMCRNVDLPLGAFAINHLAHVHSRLLKRHMHGITGIHRPKTVHPCGKPTFIALSSITRVKCKRFTGWRSPYIRKPSLPPYGTYSPSLAFLISV
ncbi:hypothetical protein AFLA70_27g004082 [Aspergillus flavus AF70]|nr:hypothetical protein AFLA70_27g004082 [Aspergillus flavus AF70]